MKCEITLEEYGNVKFSELPKAIHNAILGQLKNHLTGSGIEYL